MAEVSSVEHSFAKGCAVYCAQRRKNEAYWLRCSSGRENICSLDPMNSCLCYIKRLFTKKRITSGVGTIHASLEYWASWCLNNQ